MAIFDLFRSNTNVSSHGGVSYYTSGKHTKSGELVSPQAALEDATVLSCINVIAQGIAQLPLTLVNKADNSVSTSPIVQLTQRPNDYQTPYEFAYGLVSTLLTYGNAYLKVVRAGGRPFQLLPMDPNNITYSLNPAGYPVYSYKGDNIRIPSEDIIHIKDTVLFDVQGMSRVTLAAERIGALIAADRQMAETFRNGIDVRSTIELDMPMTPDKKRELNEVLQQAFGAGGKQRGGAFVIEGGSFKTHKGTSPADTDLRQLRENLIQEIAAVFRVPAFMVGASSDQKYSNVRQMQTALYRDTFAPLLTSIEQAFNLKLLDTTQTVCFKFDVTELLKGDVESQANVAAKLVQGGIWTPNEARAYTGKEALEGGDALQLSTPIDADDYRGTPDQPNAMAPELTGEEDNNNE